MEQRYVHLPLQGSRSIRVVHLEPAPLSTSPLSCTLKEVSFDILPEYIALSYSWDAQTPSCPITCHGRTLYVTPNCVSALQHLRDEHDVRTLWIDSICIDQTSLEERSHQVALMGEIYKQAKQVIVWLGDSDSSTKQAIQRLSDISQIGGEMDAERKEKAMRLLFGLEVRNESDDPIGPLFRRSWFHRMWTIQEVTLASVENVILCCGNDTLEWVFLVIALGYLQASKYEWGRWDKAMELQKYLSDLLIARKYPDVGKVQNNKPGSVDSQPVVLRILSYAREKASTDPKDKIFALFGILGDLGVEFPLPDYKKSVAQIYSEAVVECVNHDKSLDVLFQVPSDHRCPDLPLWVPDWSDVSWTSPDPRKSAVHDRFRAAASAVPAWKFSLDQQSLVLSGKVVDVIKHLAAPLNVDADATYGFKTNLAIDGRLVTNGQWNMNGFLRTLGSAFKILKGWVAVSSSYEKYPTGEAVQRALQRTLIGDQTPKDAKADESFDAWYRLLVDNNANSVQIGAASSSGASEDLKPFLALTAGSASAYHFEVLKNSRRKCFFTTENGYFGTAPDLILPEDKVAVIAGLGMPMILRATNQGYRLVTHAYVHGIMYGEVWPEDTGELEGVILM